MSHLAVRPKTGSNQAGSSSTEPRRSWRLRRAPEAALINPRKCRTQRGLIVYPSDSTDIFKESNLIHHQSVYSDWKRFKLIVNLLILFLLTQPFFVLRLNNKRSGFSCFSILFKWSTNYIFFRARDCSFMQLFFHWQAWCLRFLRLSVVGVAQRSILFSTQVKLGSLIILEIVLLQRRRTSWSPCQDNRNVFWLDYICIGLVLCCIDADFCK